MACSLYTEWETNKSHQGNKPTKEIIKMAELQDRFMSLNEVLPVIQINVVRKILL